MFKSFSKFTAGFIGIIIIALVSLFFISQNYDALASMKALVIGAFR